jgi:hypothetical protein
MYMSKKKLVSFRFDEDLLSLLDEKCRDSGLDRTGYISLMIRKGSVSFGVNVVTEELIPIVERPLTPLQELARQRALTLEDVPEVPSRLSPEKKVLLESIKGQVKEETGVKPYLPDGVEQVELTVEQKAILFPEKKVSLRDSWLERYGIQFYIDDKRADHEIEYNEPNSYMKTKMLQELKFAKSEEDFKRIGIKYCNYTG